MLSQNEKEIYKAWLLKPKNKEIARDFNVSEAYVSQTLKNVREKIDSLGDTLGLLQEMGLIEPTPIKLSEKIKGIAAKRRAEIMNKRPEGTYHKVATVTQLLQKGDLLALANNVRMTHTKPAEPSKVSTELKIIPPSSDSTKEHVEYLTKEHTEYFKPPQITSTFRAGSTWGIF